MTSRKNDSKITPLPPLSRFYVLCLMYLCHKITPYFHDVIHECPLITLDLCIREFCRQLSSHLRKFHIRAILKHLSTKKDWKECWHGIGDHTEKRQTSNDYIAGNGILKKRQKSHRFRRLK